MEKGEKMGLFARIFGICETKPPKDDGCWTYARGTVEIELVRAPELAESGGAIRIKGRGLQENLLVLHGVDGRFYVFGNRCTHMGRRLDPVAGSEAVRCCSISKSTYDYEGRVISGPAKGPLKTFPVSREDGKVIIPVRTS
jgi:nitrite reductase/ring-hydroxylating ferredoxin subunit